MYGKFDESKSGGGEENSNNVLKWESMRKDGAYNMYLGKLLV